MRFVAIVATLVAAAVARYSEHGTERGAGSQAKTTSASTPAAYTMPTGSGIVTRTRTICESLHCPETYTPSQVYTTIMTMTGGVDVKGHTKSYGWGNWSSMYTSYRTSTWAGLSTTTATLAASAKPSSPVSKPSTLPGYPSATKKCTVPSATANCVPCEGQGQGPYCGFDINTDAYAETPITCNVVSYDFEITQETISPDGVDRLAFLVNGQFPGPMIRVSWGDTVMVKLTNNLPADTLNGTSLHFHGIHQNGTNEYDGSVSITQCPLAPGQSMTYTWRATSYGSSWWHAHYALQAYEGIFGPLVIDGPAAAEYDDEEFVILQDWNHATVASLLDNSEIVIPGVRGGPVTLDTGLINGMNVWEGAGQFFTMKVKAGKKYRLRIVNTAIQSTFKFHIDGHNFTVIAMDFVPIIPYSTNIISINIGQRYDLILEADQDPGNYWIRSDNQQPCGTLVKPNIQAILSYQGVDVVDPTTTSLTYVPNCLDEDATNLVPIVPFTVGARPDEEYVENTLIVPDGATPNLYKWTLNGTSFLADWNGPTLYNIWEAGTYPDYSGDLTINLPELGAWVYFVIESPIPVPHPIHLHGHDFFVLASGIGSYDDSVALHLINPPRRDVAVMPVDPANGLGGYLVIAYQTSNPGVWLLHCHIGWHNVMGFALQIVENLDGIVVRNSCQMEEVCNSWHAYSSQYQVYNAPFDSGS